MAFEIKRNDLRPRYRVQLTVNEDEADLTNAASVLFIMRESLDNVLKVRKPAAFVDKDAGIVEYEWEAEDTDTSGVYNVEFEITWDDGTIQTWPSLGYFLAIITDDLG